MVTEEEPNPDLIGREYKGILGYTFVVERTATWSTQYVYVKSLNQPEGVLPIETCVSAKLLREVLP